MYHETSDSDEELLPSWRWLIGGLPRLLGWSSAGDLFVVSPEGQVAMLDPGGGNVEILADSVTAFHALLRDGKRAAALLQQPIVDAFEATNGPLPEGRCLSFTTLPVFGGAYTVENRYSLPIKEHAGVTGEIHRQIRDLPDGAKVQFKIVP